MNIIGTHLSCGGRGASSVGAGLSPERHRERAQRLDAEAEVLVQRLRAEVPSGFAVTLKL